MVLHSSLWQAKSQNSSASRTRDRLEDFLSALLMKSVTPSFNWRKIGCRIKTINEMLSWRTWAAPLFMASHPAFPGKHGQRFSFYWNAYGPGGQRGERNLLTEQEALYVTAFILSERHRKVVQASFLLKKYLLILQRMVSCTAAHHRGILFRDTTEVFWANGSEEFTMPAHLPGPTMFVSDVVPCSLFCLALPVLKLSFAWEAAAAGGSGDTRAHVCSRWEVFVHVVTRTPLARASRWRAPRLCSSCPAERLLYSKEGGRRGWEDTMLMWRLCSWSHRAGAWGQGLGPPRPHGALHWCHLVALTRKEPHCSAQFLPWGRPGRFHSGEDREHFHLSRHIPGCTSEAWRLWQTVGDFSVPSQPAPASSPLCPSGICCAAARLARCQLLGGVLENSHVLACMQLRDQHVFLQACTGSKILPEIRALPARSLPAALCQGPPPLGLQGKAGGTKNSRRMGTEAQTLFFKALWEYWLSGATSKTQCWAVQRGLQVGWKQTPNSWQQCSWVLAMVSCINLHFFSDTASK